MEPEIRYKAFALFSRSKRVERGDIVLVDHPDAGKVIRKVAAVSINGRVGVCRVTRSSRAAGELSNVDPERVLGKLVLKMNWGRFLPTFRAPPAPIHPRTDQEAH